MKKAKGLFFFHLNNKVTDSTSTNNSLIIIFTKDFLICTETKILLYEITLEKLLNIPSVLIKTNIVKKGDSSSLPFFQFTTHQFSFRF